MARFSVGIGMLHTVVLLIVGNALGADIVQASLFSSPRPDQAISVLDSTLIHHDAIIAGALVLAGLLVASWRRGKPQALRPPSEPLSEPPSGRRRGPGWQIFRWALLAPLIFVLLILLMVSVHDSLLVSVLACTVAIAAMNGGLADPAREFFRSLVRSSRGATLRMLVVRMLAVLTLMAFGLMVVGICQGLQPADASWSSTTGTVVKIDTIERSGRVRHDYDLPTVRYTVDHQAYTRVAEDSLPEYSFAVGEKTPVRYDPDNHSRSYLPEINRGPVHEMATGRATLGVFLALLFASLRVVARRGISQASGAISVIMVVLLCLPAWA